MAKSVFDEVDDWLDRIQLVDEGDAEVARFLDSLDLHGPQEREMLAELARKTPLAKPEEFPAAHRRVAAALETLGRHGYRSAAIPRWLRPKFFGRFVVELVARYVVVSYLRRALTDMRNLYWLRAIQSPVGTPERLMLRRARVEAEGLILVFRRIQLATRAPLQTLWDAIGSAGNPPRDQSRKFAVVAILVTTLTWFVVPAAIAIVFLT